MNKHMFLLGLFLIGSINLVASKKDSVSYKNEVGIVLTDLIDGSFQFTYERAVRQHLSVKIGSAYKGENGLVSLSGIDGDHIKTSDLTYSGLKLTPEIRYYIKKTQLNKLDGFYFGAYFKYSGFSSNIYGKYISSSDREYKLNFDAKLRIKTLGLQVGYKLPVSKRFNIDFLIAGPGQSWHNYSLKSNTEIPDEFFDDLNEALKNYSLYDLLNSDFHFTTKNRRTKFGMPTFRYAITFGFTF